MALSFFDLMDWIETIDANVRLVYKRQGQILALLQQEQEKIMAKIDDVDAKLSEMTDAEDAVVTLLDTIHAELQAAGNDPTKIQAVLDKMDQRKAILAAAVVRNTDAAPTP